MLMLGENSRHGKVLTSICLKNKQYINKKRCLVVDKRTGGTPSGPDSAINWVISLVGPLSAMALYLGNQSI